jgi:hypothetical protein
MMSRNLLTAFPRPASSKNNRFQDFRHNHIVGIMWSLYLATPDIETLCRSTLFQIQTLVMIHVYLKRYRPTSKSGCILARQSQAKPGKAQEKPRQSSSTPSKTQQKPNNTQKNTGKSTSGTPRQHKIPCLPTRLSVLCRNTRSSNIRAYSVLLTPYYPNTTAGMFVQLVSLLSVASLITLFRSPVTSE